MKIIEVIPNPYIALDKDGVPQGVVGAGMPGLFIGASVDAVASKATGKQRFFYPLDRDGKAAKRVYLTGDIVTAVQAGELVAATKTSALACGLTDKEFLEPEKALAVEREKALAYYRALRADANAKVAEIPRKATEVKEGETAPIETASAKLTPSVKLTKQEA